MRRKPLLFFTSVASILWLTLPTIGVAFGAEATGAAGQAVRSTGAAASVPQVHPVYPPAPDPPTRETTYYFDAQRNPSGRRETNGSRTTDYDNQGKPVGSSVTVPR